MSVVDDVITDATKECPPNFAKSSSSGDNKTSALIICDLADYLPWLASDTFYFTANLQQVSYELMRLITPATYMHKETTTRRYANIVLENCC